MIRKEIKSFGDAIRGLAIFFAKERHAKAHLGIMLLVVFAGFYYNVSDTEWISLCIAFALVIGSEALNTGIEKLSDIVQPEKHAGIRDVKDIAAGAVFFCVIIAIIIGAIIFTPKIF